MDQQKRIAIVTPVLNDWPSFAQLAIALDRVVSLLDDYRFDLVAIDDGSTQGIEALNESEISFDALANLNAIESIELVTNLGHQRAVAVGLATMTQRGVYDAVIVMDADGEDRPEDILAMIKNYESGTEKIIFAERMQRSEGWVFRAFYVFYKALFHLLTGQGISFGNFSLIPIRLVERLIYMPEIWNNLAAAIMRSRLPIALVPTRRGERYAGHSKMNFISLMVHGLGAISVHSDVVFVRAILSSVILGAVSVMGISVVIGIRVWTDAAIPGWTSFMVGTFVILLVQAVFFSLSGIFLLLHSRSRPSVVPAQVAAAYVRGSSPVVSK